MKKILCVSIALALLTFVSCQKKSGNELNLQFEKYQLDNGLSVILQQDKSDPIASVAIYYHVGSDREVKGRTGFAHLFEHMMFQQSENVPEDQFFKYIQQAGGTLNGSTNKDRTNYYEVVPKNALEMVLWMESDRMGYLSNTITAEAFVNQQNVVQNEKRQNYDNRPYGHTQTVLSKAVFPDGHPYSWTTIGEMQDLLNATVEDVKDFHSRFYVPNNATLAISGDFDPVQVKELVKKYFGEIPSGPKVEKLVPMPVTLTETKKLYHEDNFANAPQFTMVYTTPERYSKDSYALSVLSEILAGNKKSPMYKILVKEKKLTSSVRAYNGAQELAGTFNISVQANPGTDLDEVEKAIKEAYARFETEGFSEKDIERVKASLETRFYNIISSVQGKAFQLAEYDIFAGDPGFYKKDIANTMSVTSEDVKRVYETYIKGKNYVVTSFVPKGQLNLAVEGSVNAGIVEENILNATEVKLAASDKSEEIVKTPSSFDRSVKPAIGPDVKVNAPQIWKSKLENGMAVCGITQSEVPLIQYYISMKGGHVLDDLSKPGVANLTAMMLNEGTKTKTPEELEEAIELLGASIYIGAGDEGTYIYVNTLARNFEKTIDLVKEMVLEPRWDTTSFEIVKARTLNNLRRNSVDPSYLASVNLDKLILGENNILATDVMGTIESVNSITIEDLKAYYEKYFSPSISRLLIVGAVDQPRVETAFAALGNSWSAKEVVFPAVSFPVKPEKPAVYFVNVPGAKQSVISIGCLSIARTDPDFYAATVANYKLGGSFNGYLNLVLREEKGFTYGARSNFSGSYDYGTFTAGASVRSSATLESAEIFRDLMTKYRGGVSQEDVDFTKSSLLKGNALKYETLNALLDMIDTMTEFNLPDDYITREEEYVRNLTVEEINAKVQKYIDPMRMYYVVAGDAATQMKELKKLGFGDPILVK